MSYPTTYRMRLVEEVTVKVLPLVGHTIVATAGISQEIFRHDRHISSVHMPGSVQEIVNVETHEQTKVYNGDRLFHVSLMPQEHLLSGIFTTKDKYPFAYKMIVDIVVRSPVILIEKYYQRFDPVGEAIENLQRYYQWYIGQIDYEKLKTVKINFDNLNSSSFIPSFGIEVLFKGIHYIGEDPKRLKFLLIQEQANLEIEQLLAKEKQQKAIDKITWRKELAEQRQEHIKRSREKEFVREEDLKQHRHTQYKRLSRNAVDEMVAIQRERIRDAIESGQEVGIVGIDSMKVLNAYSEALQNGTILDASPSYEDSDYNNLDAKDDETDE